MKKSVNARMLTTNGGFSLFVLEAHADSYCVSDYNFIRQDNACVPAGPERIPANVCSDPDQMYLGSSGYRKIPGNTCEGGVQKDKKVKKKCSQAQPEEGNVVHQTVSSASQRWFIDLLNCPQFDFPSSIVQHSYFNQSTVSALTSMHCAYSCLLDHPCTTRGSFDLAI